MADQVKELEQVLCKLQSARGTAEAALINTDALECESGVSIEFEPRVKEISLVSGSWTQNQSVIGPRDVTISLSLPMRTGAASAAFGQINTLLQLSCLKSTVSPASVSTLVPTPKASEWKDATMWHHSGNADTSGSLITKVQNVMGNVKLSLDFDSGVAMASFEGKGVLVGEPALGTQASVTPSAVLTPSLIGSTVSFFSDADYCMESLEIDLGLEVVNTINPSAANGSGLGKVTPAKLKAKWTAKVYHDAALNPYTPLLAGTLGAISVAWGTAPNKFTVSTTKAQITGVKKSDSNGITTYDLSGIFVDNNITIAIDTTVT